MKKLIDTAYLKLKELEKNESVSWETYSKIADLAVSIEFLQKQVNFDKTTIYDIIQELRENIGDSQTLEILQRILSDFTKDLDCIQPRLTSCLINKIKENL